MALIAPTRSAGIVEPGTTDEACGGMTEMAIRRGRDMAGVLTGRANPMTGRAIIHDAGMIKHGTDKRAGVMTDTAILICGDMVGRLANGEHIIMAGAAVIHDTCMTEGCRSEACGDMAGIAVFVGRHVVGRRSLASGGVAIVARITTTGDTRVVESGTRKSRCDMTHCAVLRRRKMTS